MNRSYLFVPANRPDRYDRAITSGADVVIADLEDAVPPDQKDASRGALANWLSPSHPVLVRINAAKTPWFHDDLAICSMPGISGVLLPKAEELKDIEIVVNQSNNAGTILPIIETALGLSNAASLATVPSVERLVFGSLDLQIDLGMNAEEDELLYFRSLLIMTSRLAGIKPPVDGISTTFRDENRIRADASRARRLGFSGKLCIHPKQVAIVNEVFMPTKEEAAWANRVIEASIASGGAATSLDGVMIDRPIITKAENILSLLNQK